MKFPLSLLVAVLSARTLLALSPAEWRTQSIYQVLTDRFARTDGSTTASCDTADQVYCGGSWQGIINHLDYIQDMGFSAVSSVYTTSLQNLLIIKDLDFPCCWELTSELRRRWRISWILGAGLTDIRYCSSCYTHLLSQRTYTRLTRTSELLPTLLLYPKPYIQGVW